MKNCTNASSKTDLSPSWTILIAIKSAKFTFHNANRPDDLEVLWVLMALRSKKREEGRHSMSILLVGKI